MTTLAAGIFLSAFFLFIFIVAVAWLSENILATATTGLIVLFVLVAFGWIPPFVVVVLLVLIAILLAANWSGILTGKGGGQV